MAKTKYWNDSTELFKQNQTYTDKHDTQEQKSTTGLIEARVVGIPHPFLKKATQNVAVCRAQEKINNHYQSSEWQSINQSTDQSVNQAVTQYSQSIKHELRVESEFESAKFTQNGKPLCSLSGPRRRTGVIRPRVFGVVHFAAPFTFHALYKVSRDDDRGQKAGSINVDLFTG